MIGQCSISIKDLIEKRKDKYPLLTKNGQPAGRLLLETIFVEEVKVVTKPTMVPKFEKILHSQKELELEP